MSFSTSPQNVQQFEIDKELDIFEQQIDDLETLSLKEKKRNLSLVENQLKKINSMISRETLTSRKQRNNILKHKFERIRQQVLKDTDFEELVELAKKLQFLTMHLKQAVQIVERQNKVQEGLQIVGKMAQTFEKYENDSKNNKYSKMLHDAAQILYQFDEESKIQQPFISSYFPSQNIQQVGAQKPANQPVNIVESFITFKNEEKQPIIPKKDQLVIQPEQIKIEPQKEETKTIIQQEIHPRYTYSPQKQDQYTEAVEAKRQQYSYGQFKIQDNPVRNSNNRQSYTFEQQQSLTLQQQNQRGVKKYYLKTKQFIKQILSPCTNPHEQEFIQPDMQKQTNK